jgi:hypothetical protein
MVRIGRRELLAPSGDEVKTVTDRVVAISDASFRWVIRRILNIFPDVSRFDLTRYVSEGFNISSEQILVNFLLMMAYLLPCALLGYYLMNWREVAGAT